MKFESTTYSPSPLRSYTIIASIILVCVGLIVLTGWFFDIDFLKSVFPNTATMKFNTAMGFLCAGISLWFLKNEKGNFREQHIGQIFASLVFLIGFLALSEHIFGWNLGIDQLFIRDLNTSANSFPGRLSFITALCFSLSGLALFLIGTRVSQYASAVVFLLALLALVGYLFDYQSLYRISGYGSVALHTTFAFLILSLAIPAARPSFGIMTVITSEMSSGRTIRIFLPTIIFLTIFLGWLIKQGERMGYVDVQNGMVILVVLIILLYSPFIYLYGKQTDLAEAQIIRLSRLYATLSQVNQAIVRVKDEETLYRSICDVVIRFGKFRLAWIGILDKETGDVHVVAAQGMGAEVLDSLNLNMNWPPFDKSLIGLALRNKKIFASDNIQIDERMKHLSETGRKYEYHSAVAIPLCLRGEAIGLLNLFASGTGLFRQEDELLLLEEIGGDISFALDTIETEKERKLAGEMLRESEKKFSTLFEKAAFAAVFSSLPNGVIVDVNESFEKAFGYTKQEARGKTSSELGFNPDEEGRARTLAQLKEHGFARNQEMPLRTKSGEVRFFSVNIDLIDIGSQKYILNTTQDITERKRAEDELEKLNDQLEKRVVERTTQLEVLNKELESFSYSVSHDLRAPLRAIDGFSQALLDEDGDRLSEEGRGHLTRVVKSVRRMTELIEALLNLSRITRASFGSVPVNLSVLASEIALGLQENQPQRKVNFVIAPNLVTQGDLNLLWILLENLLNNAFKFTSKRELAEIEFNSKNENGKVIYFVRDNGAGFNMDYADKLFGAFQRLHNPNEFEGTGVGLATVQRIIQRHEGRIWAESAVDKGATFHFTLF